MESYGLFRCNQPVAASLGNNDSIRYFLDHALQKKNLVSPNIMDLEEVWFVKSFPVFLYETAPDARTQGRMHIKSPQFLLQIMSIWQGDDKS